MTDVLYLVPRLGKTLMVALPFQDEPATVDLGPGCAGVMYVYKTPEAALIDFPDFPVGELLLVREIKPANDPTTASPGALAGRKSSRRPRPLQEAEGRQNGPDAGKGKK